MLQGTSYIAAALNDHAPLILQIDKDLSILAATVAGPENPHIKPETVDELLSDDDVEKVKASFAHWPAYREWLGQDRYFVDISIALRAITAGDESEIGTYFLVIDDPDHHGREERTPKQLEARTGQLEMILGAMPNGILIFEQHSDEPQIYVNWRLLHLLGRTQRPSSARLAHLARAGEIRIIVEGQTYGMIEWLQSQFPQMPKSLPRGTAQIMDPDMEIPLDVSYAIAPLYDVDEGLSGCLLSLTDITELERLRAEALQRVNQQRAISQLGLFAMSQPEVDSVFDEACRSLAQVLGVRFSRVLKLSDDGSDFTFVAGNGWDADALNEFSESVSTDTETSKVLREGFAWVPNYADDGYDRSAAPLLEQHKIESSVSALISQRGSPWGVLGVHSARTDAFTKEDLGLVSAFANVLSNILDRRLYEQELAESRAKLADAERQRELEHAKRLAALGTMAAGVAHEINNPLNAIMGNSELAKLLHQSNESPEECLDRILEECRRAAGVIKNVLGFARKTPKTLEPVNLAEMVDHVRETLAQMLQDKEAALNYRSGEQTVFVLGSELDMEQILTNLVLNSLQAGAKNCTVSAESRGEYWLVRVTDDGPGIAAEDADRVFEPFYSKKRGEGGTGLGLSLVQQMVEGQGGNIELRDGPESGCEFLIRLRQAEGG